MKDAMTKNLECIHMESHQTVALILMFNWVSPCSAVHPVMSLRVTMENPYNANSNSNVLITWPHALPQEMPSLPMCHPSCHPGSEGFRACICRSSSQATGLDVESGVVIWYFGVGVDIWYKLDILIVMASAWIPWICVPSCKPRVLMNNTISIHSMSLYTGSNAKFQPPFWISFNCYLQRTQVATYWGPWKRHWERRRRMLRPTRMSPETMPRSSANVATCHFVRWQNT